MCESGLTVCEVIHYLAQSTLSLQCRPLSDREGERENYSQVTSHWRVDVGTVVRHPDTMLTSPLSAIYSFCIPSLSFLHS